MNGKLVKIKIYSKILIFRDEALSQEIFVLYICAPRNFELLCSPGYPLVRSNPYNPEHQDPGEQLEGSYYFGYEFIILTKSSI